MTHTTDAACLHDYVLLGYRVDCKRRTIVLRAEYLERGAGSGPRVGGTEVTFAGVEAYHFHDDAFGNIIFELKELDFETLWREQRDALRASHTRSGAAPWAVSDDRALEYLRKHAVRAYQLSSSIGLSGWVFAREVTTASSQGEEP